MKRVWCLYRVSTKQQVGTEDDIPMQEKACHDYVKGKGDWEITKELFEKGVSGWSKRADERDEMNIIKQGAMNNEYDILLVFMFDRLGRREDETPLVVNFLKQNNVEVWSTQEGPRSMDSHVDKLINYISFWQSDGESQKTSMRVKEAKKQLSEQGYFQGGAPPIGYKIVETEQVHWKNKDRRIKELVADEHESEMIKLIFSLYVDRHMGYRKIIEYLHLNGYRTREGKVFGISTIQRILLNPIYIGLKRYQGADGEEGATQPYNEKLRIISDDLFKQAEQIRLKRSGGIKEQDKSEIPRVGKLMFSGLAYCKYCGAKLSGNYLTRNQKRYNKDGYYKNTIYRYRCPLNKGKYNCDHKQNIWGAKKYDKIIIKQLKEILSQLNLETFVDSSISQKKSLIKQKERNINNLEKEHLDLTKQLDKLNSEIVKSLMGDSDFTPQQLSGAINTVEEQMGQKLEQLNFLKVEVDKERENYSDVNYIANELENWESKFDNADDDLKKAMLSRVINKVYLGKDEVDLELNLMLSEFFQEQIEAESTI
ncbi:recombinase family protein [Lysinibacillus pakistanensis]|uniref:recombinase family protein n=1 Tax=Lysinibacillus pakistanensis TaxID=759811 RepID=UPI003D2A216B